MKELLNCQGRIRMSRIHSFGILVFSGWICPLTAQTPAERGDVLTTARQNESARPSPAVPPIDMFAPRVVGTATFSMGCFWCPDAVFGAVPGVVRTRVGYAGGSTRDPDYDYLGDHVESVQIDYDPNRMTYEDLLEIFWRHHDITLKPLRPQYRCAVFVADHGQAQLARQSREKVVHQAGTEVETQILPATRFYPAEAYHQKFQLRQHPKLLKEIATIYSRDVDMMNSTLCARLNAILAGYGKPSQIMDEIASYGLTPEAHQLVLEFIEQLHEE